MTDAIATRPAETERSVDPRSPDLRHLELIEQEVSRHRQNALRIRLAGVALVAGYVALHGAQAQPRYMFLAPVIALGAWILDAHADWNMRALRLVARAVRGEIGPRPAPLSLDPEPWSEAVSWRQAMLRPARAAFFHPLATMAAFIAVDAPRLDPDGTPSELFWYLAVSFVSFAVLVVVAWSWWYDHFGEATAPTFPVAPPRPRVSEVPTAFRSADGPFPPSTPRTDATRPFGTAVGSS